MKALVGGSWYEFPETLAIDDFDLSVQVPSLALAGRDGEIVSGRITTKPLRFTATGILKGVDRATADALERAVKAKILGKILKLYPFDDYTYYLNCYVESISSMLNRGKFNYGIVALTIKFLALDPFRHLEDSTNTFPIAGSTLNLLIDNPGDIPVFPNILFTASGNYNLAGTIVACGTRTLELSTGQAIAATKTFAAGEDYALIDGISCLSKLASQSLVAPIELLPGLNAVAVYGSGLAGTMVISFSPGCY